MAHESTPKQSVEIVKTENADPVTDASYLQRYPLLADKTEE